MTEQEEALAALRPAGILDAFLWARKSAHARAMQDFDPGTGHDQVVLGVIAYRLLCDRLDRVFSCGRYALATPAEAGVGLDLLVEGLTADDVKTLPAIAPGVVVTSNLNGSPGWRYGKWRWLLASFEYGDIDQIHWARKSPTKRSVAAQAHPDQLALFEGDGANLDGAFSELAAEDQPTDVVSTIVAHSLDRHTGSSQLYFGRPLLNSNGGPAWHWRVLLGDSGTPGGGVRVGPQEPTPSDPNSVPDAPVRLRRKSTDTPGNQAAGQT